jgi:5-methylcytosine-specific restriction endonuclease McrA
MKNYQSNWRKENPDKVKEYNKDRNMHKKHEITNEEWFECLDYFNNSCAYCGITEEEQVRLYGEQFHKEHVIQNGSNYIDNCVPSCTSCNTSKNTKEFNDWYNYKNINFTQKRLDKIIEWMTEECFKTLNLIY